MKTKSYFIVLFVVLLFLIYYRICYRFVNKTIDIGTQNIIKNYMGEDFHYQYVGATVNTDESINVYIRDKNRNYYHFRVFKNGVRYEFLDCDQEVPSFIKKGMIFY